MDKYTALLSYELIVKEHLFADNADMNLVQNVSLADHSTMRLGGTARYLLEIHSRVELSEAITWAKEQQIEYLMIGSGSNIVWRDEGYPGLVIVNALQRYEQFDEDEINTYITVGGGEVWDSVVARSVAAGLTGIEALSAIPGTAGATPVQNVGAYGQEIAQTLVSLEAYDTQSGEYITIPASDCGFGYRTSRFKTTDRGRFLITALTLHLSRQAPQPPFYPAVAEYLIRQGLSLVNAPAIRKAVIAIRAAKLPDPSVVANCGSFFGNPIISNGQLVQLQADLDTAIPHWPTDDGQHKIPAAWLIEQVGFKDTHDAETGMATWPTQPLVLVNEHASSTSQLLSFKDKIAEAVFAKFAIQLEQEPELLPSA